MPVGDDQSVKAAKALALPTRSAILSHLLKSDPLTAREVASAFSLHANVARAHLDLLVEAGFLATGVRRQGKGRPAKVYFTWEGEMGAPEDWEVSPLPKEIPAAELIADEELTPATPPQGSNRLLAAVLVQTLKGLSREKLYQLVEAAATEEGRKLVFGYRTGGLDFPAAVRAMVEEFRRFSPGARISRLEHDYAEVETPDCPFRDIALEHSDLVAIIDPALKEGAMSALGHPSEVEVEASVARGDQICREIIRRKESTKTAKKGRQ